MAAKVRVAELVDELDMLSDETHVYVNRVTGKVAALGEEEMALAEDEERDEDSLDDTDDWQLEMIREAEQVLESDDWIAAPTKFDIHEWEIMRRFALSREDPDVSEDLLEAIGGRGAFRSFKNRIRRLGVADDWYAFRHKAIEEIAVEWLEERGIEYVREKPKAESANG